MRKPLVRVLACICAAGGLSACATAHKAEGIASDGMRGGARVASTGASMVKTTVNETYNGLGGAVRSPLRDFNMMQEALPVALMKARESVYDIQGLTTCEAIGAEIQALDVELGPDIDTPRVENQRSRSQRLASAAADGAVNAARGALDHYIPVRGVVRQLSGARKYEKETARALLAGNVRRGFLKAVGMHQNCGWPAAPISFKPGARGALVQLAAAPAPAASSDVAAPKIASNTAPASTPPILLVASNTAAAPVVAPTAAASVGVVSTAREAEPPAAAGLASAQVTLAAAKPEQTGVILISDPPGSSPQPVPRALGFSAGAVATQSPASPGLR